MIEPLESRRFLSVTAAQSGTTLNVNGNNANDYITVRENGGTVDVAYTDSSGVFHDPFNGAPDASDHFTGITAININGQGGNDTIFYTGNSVGATIHGDGSTTGGSGGGKGADAITVSDDGSGHSIVSGDQGNDGITLLHGSQTQVNGNDGNDYIYLNTDTSRTDGTSNVNAGKGDDRITIYAGTNTVNGGDGKDTVFMDVPAGFPGDQTNDGFANPALQTLISIEQTATF